MMFSASRSRRLQIVPIIQSFAQLEKNYGKEGADVIIDNTQLTIFGGFAPNRTSAETLSKALGSRTVMSGSVSRSKDNPSQSVQMIERPLMTSDELKNLPKGTRSVELGFDIKTLSEILGHSSVRTTMDRYVHTSSEKKRENMNKLNLYSF